MPRKVGIADGRMPGWRPQAPLDPSKYVAKNVFFLLRGPFGSTGDAKVNPNWPQNEAHACKNKCGQMRVHLFINAAIYL